MGETVNTIMAFILCFVSVGHMAFAEGRERRLRIENRRLRRKLSRLRE